MEFTHWVWSTCRAFFTVDASVKVAKMKSPDTPKSSPPSVSGFHQKGSVTDA